MVMESINGLMEENSQVIGFVTKCMDKVFSLGPMVESIKVIISMTKNRDMVFLHGLMVVNTMVHGWMGNKKELEFIITQKEKLDMDTGKMESV